MKWTSIRNLLILGAAGVGGYLVYRHFKNKAAEASEGGAGPAAPTGTKREIAAAAARIAVRPGQMVSTASTSFIRKRETGFTYAPVVTDTTKATPTAMFFYENGKTALHFNPTISGFFTGRILVDKQMRWAELSKA